MTSKSNEKSFELPALSFGTESDTRLASKARNKQQQQQQQQQIIIYIYIYIYQNKFA
jgi:hypothetical protein